MTELNLNNILLIAVCLLSCISCNETYTKPPSLLVPKDSILQAIALNKKPENSRKDSLNFGKIVTGSTTPNELLLFARSLQGTPYAYGSVDPAIGFDCSGFITYVFNHFNITVPRSSESFINIEKEIPVAEAVPGDLLLFTGTDSASQTVGHMGIVESKINNQLFFIHASSGKANGVTISPFEGYYKSRFVKAIRVFP